MNKRTILTIIITGMCLMNIFAPIIPDLEPTYFDLFTEAMDDKSLNSFWKTLFMSPTGILLVLTGLHIAEPRSVSITRNHLAIAAITGFILYVIIFLILFAIGDMWIQVFGAVADYTTGKKVEREGMDLLSLGWQSLLYPILFLAYVLVHRFMSYDSPEHFVQEDTYDFDNRDQYL